MSCVFQFPVAGSIRSETFDKRWRTLLVRIFLDGLQISMLSPLPTLQISPSLRVLTPAIILCLCHVKEAPFFKLALRRFPSGKYFGLRMEAQNESAESTSLHTCFERRARLKQWISRNTIPP
ncbi:hypothetical protein BRADI_1g60104v3 [Brachypodium distachyon]|uniref:Uncharacterized protein n=1 Tax=Brachypodium distachyon TaxID=15368 RepID=A0A2K2DSK1_BRADI|nr:hypothetical protein BRADI_1g60104v3 [Brachypodium distachyon]